MISDNSMDEEARRWVLKGEGWHKPDGLAARLGYDRVQVRPFSTSGVDVWFYRPNDPCN